MKRNPYNFPWSECEFDGNLWKSGTKVKVTQESMKNGYQFQKEFMSKVIENKHLTLDTIIRLTNYVFSVIAHKSYLLSYLE